MRSSLADSAAADKAASSVKNEAGGGSRPAKSSYVPPHLRGKPLVNEPPATSPNNRMGGGSSQGGPRSDIRQGYSHGGSSSTFQSKVVRKAPESGSRLSDDKHSLSLKVGAFLMRFVKGKWGSTQKRIEEETGVKIIFPSSRDEDYIVIKGSSADSISRASKIIQSIVDEAVNNPTLDYSHFISLPLALHPELVEKLVNFRISILETNNLSKDENSGIEESIFIKPETLHLTVLMLRLWNQDRVSAAAEVLQRVASKVNEALNNRPVSIRLKGLQIMTGSFEQARIVYLPVEEIGGKGRLERACQVIIDAFVEAGIVLEKDVKRKLKLHATVMTVSSRKRNQETSFRDSFNARGTFKKYGSEKWGEYLIPEAHLSQRYVFDENGYYHRCSSITFP